MNWRIFKKAVIGVLKDALPVAIMLLIVLAIIGLGFVGAALTYAWFGKWGVVVWIGVYIAFAYFSIAVSFRMRIEAQRERELAYEVAKRMEGKPMYNHDEF